MGLKLPTTNESTANDAVVSGEINGVSKTRWSKMIISFCGNIQPRNQ